MGREKARVILALRIAECRTQQGHGVTVTHIPSSTPVAEGFRGHWTPNPLALLLSSQSPQCSRLLPALLRAYILMQETITKLIKKIILLYSEVQYMKNWHKRQTMTEGREEYFIGVVREDVSENLAFDTAPKKDRRESGMHVQAGAGMGVDSR